MPTLDLRHFFGLLQKNRELLRVADAVDLRHELSEFLHQTDRAHGPALQFENIKGHSMKVVGNLVGTKKRKEAPRLGPETIVALLARRRALHQARRRRDDDFDVQDPPDVDWAIATRVQGDQDLVVIPNRRARSIDPLKQEGMFTAKVGIDATVPIAEKHRFKRIAVPSKVKQSGAKRLASIMSPGSNRGLKD